MNKQTESKHPGNRPGRPRGDTLERRRRHLLETARRLFLDRGFSEAPLADIARSAGVALRTIYVQYGNKAGLLRALVDDEEARHRAELADLNLEGKPWQEQLAALALHVARRARRPDLMRLRDIIIAHGDPELLDAIDQAGPGRVREQLCPILSAAAGEGVLHGLHSHAQLCDHFIVCVAGLRAGPGAAGDTVQACARRGYDLFLRVLQAAH